jgi:solute carrier family 25 protein 34/35
MQSAPGANHLVKEPQTITNGFVTKAKAYLLGGIATSTAAIVTNPMDVVKSRLQVQGELHKYDPTKLVYRGQLDAVVKIFNSEGYINGLQKGLAPAMAYQFCMNGMRLGTYSLLSTATQNLMPEYNFIRLLLCGAFSGMVGACSASPLFLVKTRMQIQSNTSKIGEQYNF